MKVEMSEFHKRREIVLSLPLAGVAIALIFGSVDVTTQLKAGASKFERARQLLEQAFPDLIGSDLPTKIMIDTSFNNEWLFARRLVIHIYGRETVSKAAASSNLVDDEYLDAEFVFDREQFEYVGLSGQRVKSRQMASLTEEAAAHPEWTDTELVLALEKVHGKYAPNSKAAFINTAFARVSRAFGAVRKPDITFRWRLGDSSLGPADIVTPTWVAKFDVTDSNQRRRCYTLLFEPLDGNLTGVVGGAC
jgi:hypothetical protein